MKRTYLVIGGALAALTLGACAKDYAGDGKKLADMMCRAQKLQEQSSSDTANMALVDEAAKLMTEAEELMKSLEAKYNETEREELQKAFLAATSSCT